jgi:hypothetical protein
MGSAQTVIAGTRQQQQQQRWPLGCRQQSTPASSLLQGVMWPSSKVLCAVCCCVVQVWKFESDSTPAVLLFCPGVEVFG